MGGGGSKNHDSLGSDFDGDGVQGAGGQLYVSLKIDNMDVRDDLVPHVFGSIPIIGSWDSSRALSMERESAFTWELSFVVPPNHGTLVFKFLLKPKGAESPCFVEVGEDRFLTAGKMEGGARAALFMPHGFGEGDMLEYRVFVIADIVSPFDLAASWRAYKENLRPSTVRGIPDISINAAPEGGQENASAASLEIDLERYVVPSPSCASPDVYEANLTENPRPLDLNSIFIKCDTSSGSHKSSKVEFDHTASDKAMPAAAGAVAAAAVADQMLGLKEDHCLAIVLVGLPARGKTFTAAKLTRYLRWLGHETKHFNVGKYRRLKHGVNQVADFFRGDNPEGVEARNEIAALAMDDMLSWMQEGGQVGVFDATNSTKQRRNMIMKMAEGKCKIIFLETICNDEQIIERNIRLKIQQSPDYAEETDFDAGLRDFKERLANYGKVYEPVEEGSYVKMIDMVSGYGGQIQVNNISGYLPGRIVFFLVNTHLTPRPILLTRHGESQDNVRGRIGGDSILSEAGEIYSRKLANFIKKRLKSEKTASIWTSTLQRTILTATPITGFPKIQWRALEEINAGACDGMTYGEIKRIMPEEFESRQKDKLRYRYPRGESYLDVIQRLEPVIIELERQRAPVVVISHQAVLRALYSYFADIPLKDIPFIEVPLNTIIEIQMGVTGVQEKTNLSLSLSLSPSSISLPATMKGPGLYSDIGKKARDLLTRDYSYDQKVSISTRSATGAALTSCAVKKGGLYALDVSAQYKYKNALIDFKVDTDSNITTTFTLLEAVPATKALFQFKLPDYNSGKMEVQYFHEHASLASSMAMKLNPVIDLSASFGAHGIVFGAETGFDTLSGVFTKYNAGFALKKPEHDVSIILADKGDTLRASYVYHLDPKQKSSAVAEITRRFSTNENTFSVGGAYAVDRMTTVKARLNNSGNLGALLQHKVRPKSILTLSGEFETKALDRTPKFGLALAIKP